MKNIFFATALNATLVALSSCGGHKNVGPNLTPNEARDPAVGDAALAPNAKMQELLDKQVAIGAQPLDSLDPQTARLQPTLGDAMTALIVESGASTAGGPELVSIRESTVTGAAGAIVARFYIPIGPEVKPVILYYHGGGFVVGNRDSYDNSARELSKKTGALVMSVDYRRAPEFRFPAAHDDAYAAYKWALKRIGSMGGDVNRIAIAGESAGGNLALNIALRARDEGLPMPKHILLIYPVVGTDFDTPTYQIYADAKPLSRNLMKWFLGHYADPFQMKDPMLNLNQADLKKLPPTTLIAAQIDPLFSEGRTLYHNLGAAGVDVAYRSFEGVTHEFFGLSPWLDEAVTAQNFAADRLKSSF